MLGNKNTNKKTVMSGVGIALLLCALMVGMTMTNLVQTDAPQVESDLAVASEDSDDYFALPDVYEPAQYEYDETSELEGMRTMNQKAYRLDNGDTSLITSSEPIHYMSDIGSWEQIDLNIMATAYGWEVKENIYEVSFASEFHNGVSVVVNQNVDPIITGINPTVVTLDESGTMPIAYMTSPFGYNLFLMRAMAPKEIDLIDIYRSIIPFVLVMCLGLAIVMIFPEIATWLPDYVSRR